MNYDRMTKAFVEMDCETIHDEIDDGLPWSSVIAMDDGVDEGRFLGSFNTRAEAVNSALDALECSGPGWVAIVQQFADDPSCSVISEEEFTHQYALENKQ